MKTCAGCLKDLPLADFAKRAASRDGLQRLCRTCAAEQYQEWKAANPAICAASNRRWQRAHLDRGRVKVKRYQAVKRGATVALSFTADQLAQRVAFYGGRCWMCGAEAATDLDHVKPIVAGGAHMLANLRPACGTCNRKKGATWPMAQVLQEVA